MPFVIACVECDCDSPDSYDEAIAAGWTQITYAPDAFSSNFYGYCPEHRFWELEVPEAKLPEDQPGEDSP